MIREDAWYTRYIYEQYLKLPMYTASSVYLSVVQKSNVHALATIDSSWRLATE